jgi:hypothetical protein
VGFEEKLPRTVSQGDAPSTYCGWLKQKKITHYFSAYKAKIVTMQSANFCLTKRGSDFVSSGVPNSPSPQILSCGQTKSFW